jgi:hypothetical protein
MMVATMMELAAKLEENLEMGGTIQKMVVHHGTIGSLI